MQSDQANLELLRSAVDGNVPSVSRLLANPHVNINYQDEDGVTALGWAATYDYVEVVKVLILHGANLDLQDYMFGESALLCAARMGHLEVARELLRAGANVNLQGTKRRGTALLWAADEGHVEIVAALLQIPTIDLSLADKDGNTAFDVAKTDEIRNMITQYSAQRKAPTDFSLQSTTFNTEVDVTAIYYAQQQGSKEWRRSKFSVVGEGRAGKTAFTNAVVDKPFEETASTVGINQLTCDVKHVKSSAAATAGAGGGAGGQDEQQWGESKRGGGREYETALVELMALNKRKAAASGRRGEMTEKQEEGSASQNRADIREYMKAEQQSTISTTEVEASAAGQSAEAHACTSTITASSISIVASIESDSCAYDEEMVMKMLATMKDEESGLLISLFDFGGQAVFDVIHHLFLTRNGVYALVFNMEWLIHVGPEKDKALRFMRSWLSSIAVHTFDKTTQMTAPIVLVGTRLDLVPSSAVHEQISTLLHEHFSDNLAWRSVLENEDGRDSNGKATQCFFPVDNKLGKKGATMKQLMSVVHGAIESAAYTHKQVPLTWFKLIDQMSDTKRDCLTLSEVSAIAAKCGVTESEVPLFLAFLHDMGHLMWHNEPELRDVVILDPISYLVTPATIIICKLRPDHDDSTHHSMPSHRECAKLHKHEWVALKNDGVLNTKLLPILWKDYLDHSHVLLLLMVKFGLLVPLRSAAVAAAGGGDQSKSNSSSNSVERHSVNHYLVPTLLAPAPVADPHVLQWTGDGAMVSSCYFVFTLAHELEFKSTIMEGDLKSMGFLPSGMFERLIGRALSWSQDTAKGACIDLQSVMLYKDMAVMSFGCQRFRIVHCADIHCVRVDIEGRNPISVQQRLLDFITKIMNECMKSLCCFPAVSYSSIHASTEGLALTDAHTGLKKGLLPTELLVPLQQLRSAAKGESMLAWRGGRTLLSVTEIKDSYGQWLQLYDLRERYDVFISYRWGEQGKPQYDSDFTGALFDMFTNFSVGEQNRAVEVFLDRKRLQEGRLFKLDFAAALCSTLVAVPVVTMEALSRMLDHSPDRVDNVLLEWIIMIECFAAQRILKVYPILFGARQQHAVSTTSTAGGGGGDVADGVLVGNFFSDYSKLIVPKVVPSATLLQAAELLRANKVPISARFETYTVHFILTELQQYMSCQASNFASCELVEVFAGNVVDLLSKCGAAELNKVVAGGDTAAIVVPPSITILNNPAPALLSPTGGTMPSDSVRSLKELSAEEVCALLRCLKLNKVAAIFAENEVSGLMLHFCKQAEDLMAPDFGMTSTAIAEGLMEHVNEWKAHGVTSV